MTYMLSVCIPTYNMGKYLAELLACLESQLRDDVEVVICDNGSTDDSEAIVRSFTDRLHNIQYYSNGTNVGPDINFLRVISLANGEYCWLMGADDVVKEHAIRDLVNEIRESRCDVYLCDRDEFDIHMKFKSSRRWLDCNSQREFTFSDKGKFLEYFKNCNSLGSLFSYMSCLIVRRSSWEAAPYDRDFENSYYSHVYKVFSLLATVGGARLKYLNRPLVDCRTGNDSFALDGAFRRYAIDIDGYYRLGQALFADCSVRRAFWGVLVDYTPWYRLAKARHAVRDSSEWKQLCHKLTGLGFSVGMIRFAGIVGSIGPLMQLLLLTWQYRERWRAKRMNRRREAFSDPQPDTDARGRTS